MRSFFGIMYTLGILWAACWFAARYGTWHGFLAGCVSFVAVTLIAVTLGD